LQDERDDRWQHRTKPTSVNLPRDALPISVQRFKQFLWVLLAKEFRTLGRLALAHDATGTTQHIRQLLEIFHVRPVVGVLTFPTRELLGKIEKFQT